MIYGEYCADCHGGQQRDFSGSHVSQVVPAPGRSAQTRIARIVHPRMAVNLGTPYAGSEYRLKSFRDPWLRQCTDGRPVAARALSAQRFGADDGGTCCNRARRDLQTFWRGNDRYDQVALGGVSDLAEGGRSFFLYDTAVPGSGNMGHEGARYGTELSDADKWALISTSRPSSDRETAMQFLSRLPRWLKVVGMLSLIVVVLLGYIGWDRFLRAYPAQAFDDPDERFKYGSIGAEQDAGIPTGSSTCCRACFPTSCPARAAMPRSV